MENITPIVPPNDNLQPLIDNIAKVLQEARGQLAKQINSTMTKAYWQIGKYIVEYEQGGQAKVGYGESTLKELSQRLTAMYGRGYSRPNLVNMRKFYLTYPNCQSMTDILSWTPPIGIILSHYKDDLMIEYATYGMNTNLFVQRYELYLPNKEQLRAIVNRTIEEDEDKDD